MDDPWTSVQPHLLAGERVLWTGRPDPSVMFAPGDLVMVPMGILWCVFTVAWTLSALRQNSVLFVIFAGVPFTLVGCYFVVGRYFHTRLQKRRTSYALTDQRALVIARRWTVDSPVRGQPIGTRRTRDGRHVNVTFGVYNDGRGLRMPSSYSSSGMTLFGGPGTAGVAFYDVADPDALLRALDQARAALDSRE